ncbi:MAG: ABC transporter ATP-binding protein [Verrucomicrobia bacterium]|nr:ABC transporter ATP-binding protein [Verrucomicrobiota bacterium]
MSAVLLDRVSRRFGGLFAVKEISLNVEPGARLAILGPNGAGKSTLFNLITGDLRPTSGRIELFSRDVTRQPAFRRSRAGVTRTYQVSALFTELDVAHNLYLGLLGSSKRRCDPIRQVQRDKARLQRAEGIARAMGLENRFRSPVAELSHGERRQLELGLALAGNPRIILLDEPAAGLSPAERNQLRILLSELPRTVTLVLVEHDMDIALRVADRVAVLDNGRLVAEGDPQGITTNPLVQEIYLGTKHGA